MADDDAPIDLTDETVFDEQTPTTVDPCPECGEELTRTPFAPPGNAEQAFARSRVCMAATDGGWNWCPRTAWMTYESPSGDDRPPQRLRVSFERRVIMRAVDDERRVFRRKPSVV